ncbi:MAG: DUF4365 domain-containing protein, partial [Acidobacteria bacterium]|nr:DUF4365 domain-containing protein [Acidobacteriota bacterium]
MNPKEIGRTAGRIFYGTIPSNWADRGQEDQEDYGIDGELEVIDTDDHATGFIFKVQIKGKKEVTTINDGETASFSISVERLKYYMRQIEIPVILIVVDVSKEQVFWKSLQDDNNINDILETSIKKNQDTATIHIPISNTLPEKSDQLLEAVAENLNWLRANALSRMTQPIQDFIKKSPTDRLSELQESSKLINFHIFIEKFERL